MSPAPATRGTAHELDPGLEPLAPPAPRRRARPGAPRLRVAAARPARRSLVSVAGPVLLGLLFVAVLGVVVFQALLVQTQSRLDDLDDQLAVEQQRADDLRVELAALRSPERIVAEASDRLGMVPPEQILYLQHDLAHDRGRSAGPPADGPSPDEAAVDRG